MDTVGYIIGGANCSHCLFFSGWRKRKHVSWECGCVVHVRWSDRIVQCNCKLKRGKFLSFFPYLATVCSFLAVGVWAALYIVGFLL